MSELFKVKCADCGYELKIVSPAHLICQKCGSGQLEFANAVIFSCHQGHEERGRIASELCKKCHMFEQRPLRNFEHAKPVERKVKEPVEPPVKPAEQKPEPAIKRTKIKTRKKK